jgi:hypothetical protein
MPELLEKILREKGAPPQAIQSSRLIVQQHKKNIIPSKPSQPETQPRFMLSEFVSPKPMVVAEEPSVLPVPGFIKGTQIEQIFQKREAPKPELSEVGPPSPSKSRIGSIITGQATEYTPASFFIFQNIQLARQRQITRQIISQRKNIIPSMTYTWERPGLKGLQTGTGIDVKRLLTSELMTSVRQEKELKGYMGDITKFPSGTRIVKKDQYSFDIFFPPTSNVDLIKKEFYSRHPVEQHMAEMAAPAAQFITGVGALLERVTGGAIQIRPQEGSLFTGIAAYAPTLTDVFPWSPEWRKEWLYQRIRESPISLVTMGAGEGILAFGTTQGFKLASSGFKTTSKIVVPKIESIVSKSTRVTPTLEKLWGSETIRNFEKWAVEGYKPGKRLLEVPSSFFNVEKGGLTFQRFNYVTDKTVGFWERRIWMSPGEIAKYESRLTGSGKLFIGFPESKAIGGVGDIIGVSEGEIFKRGIFGLKPRYYIYSTMEKQIGKEAGSLVSDIDFSRGLGGFVRGEGIVTPTVEFAPGTPNVWFESVKNMYRSGYPYRFTTLESGKQIIDFTSGFGEGASWVFEKGTWGKPNILSKAAFREFVGDVRGVTSSLINRFESINLFPKSGTWFRGLTGVSVPTGGMIPSSIVGVGAISLTSLMQNIKPREYQLKIPMKMEIPSEIERYSFAPVSIQKNVNDVVNRSLQRQDSLTKQISLTKSAFIYNQDILTKSEQVYKQMTLIKIVTPPVSHYRFFDFKPYKFKPLVIFPKGFSGYGIGTGFDFGRIMRTGYRHRKHRVPTLKDLIGW